MYWVARCLEIDTIIGQGVTQEEAIAELEENEATWLAMAPEVGIEIPEPKIAAALINSYNSLGLQQMISTKYRI